MNRCGIVHLIGRVVIYAEPLGDIFSANAARTSLENKNGESIPWEDWADEFCNKMPKELQELEIEASIKASDSDLDKEIESMLKESSSFGKEHRGFVSLVIKFYIMSNDNEKLDSFYSVHLGNLMKRDILIYSHYYYSGDFNKSLESFIYLISNYYLDSSNLFFLIYSSTFFAQFKA